MPVLVLAPHRRGTELVCHRLDHRRGEVAVGMGGDRPAAAPAPARVAMVVAAAPPSVRRCCGRARSALAMAAVPALPVRTIPNGMAAAPGLSRFRPADHRETGSSSRRSSSSSKAARLPLRLRTAGRRRDVPISSRPVAGRWPEVEASGDARASVLHRPPEGAATVA